MRHIAKDHNGAIGALMNIVLGPLGYQILPVNKHILHTSGTILTKSQVPKKGCREGGQQYPLQPSPARVSAGNTALPFPHSGSVSLFPLPLGRGGEAPRLGREDGAGERDLALAARPRQWRRARRVATSAASKVRGSSAARAASMLLTAGLHARTRIGSATKRRARHR